MSFEIRNKVAIVTGAASGIGFDIVKELLSEGIKGVTIIDINEESVLKTVREVGDSNRVLYMKADVTVGENIEDAFRKTIDRFGHVDILINNAGICDEENWEKEIDINMKSVVQGMVLGINKYLPKHRRGPESVILNISCLNAILPSPDLPVYSCTKMSVLAFTRNWGQSFIYDETKVRVLCICPGRNDVQKSNFVAKEAMKVMKFAPNGSIWAIENSQPAYRYSVPHRKTMRKN